MTDPFNAAAYLTERRVACQVGAVNEGIEEAA